MKEDRKKIIILLSGIALIMASIIAVVIYFSFFKNENYSKSDVLTVECPNITASVGESVYLPIQLSNENATLTFEIYDSSIAKIENKTIYALSPGTTLVKITASFENKYAVCNFYFTAEREDYVLELIPISDCSFDNNILMLAGTSCQFKISLFDKFGCVVENPEISFLCSDGISIELTPFGYMLEANGKGNFIIDFYQLNFKVDIIVSVQIS